MNKKVSIERCSSYNYEEVYNSLKRAAEKAGGLDVAGKTVLLKPNILADEDPKKAITTHPVFVEAAIRLIREMGSPRILVGDSPSSHGPDFSAQVSGIAQVTQKNGAEWVYFSKKEIDVPFPDGKVMKKFSLTRVLEDADIIINLPKLKTHQFMFFTGAIKNMFGLVPSSAKSPFHGRFSRRELFAAMLVDLNLAVKPAYAFMDAITGMEGSGPFAGNPRHIGLVLASSNMLAMDIAACNIVGYPPLDIPVIKDALLRKHWLKNINEIEYPGLTPSDVRIGNFVKIPIPKSSSQDNSAPQINHTRCIRCSDCLRICPAQAMSLDGKGKESQVEIDYDLCIRCFCCHEICSAKAIDIAKKPPNRKV